jgi:hypothetical protein
MIATMCAGLVARVRGFHEDERGDVMQNICVGGVGALGCAALWGIIKNFILPLLQKYISQQLGGSTGIGSSTGGTTGTDTTTPSA